MNFSSDNGAGVAPEIIAAIAQSSRGVAPAYGADDYCRRAEAALQALFECDLRAFFIGTGTAANGLALGALARPWEAIFCHEEAHIQDDECGAPELFTAGAKLVGVPGIGGKITPTALAQTLTRFPRGIVRAVQPGALSLSQVTEAGTLYTCAEIAALAQIGHSAGLGVHMDGARFANAIVALGVSPADMTWRVGVDALCLGATKNGALACEAVVFFDLEKAAQFAFARKRGGHTLSKGRFLGAQMEAWLADDLWRRLARAANAAAAGLAQGLGAIAGVRLPWPVEANELFPILPERAAAALADAGAKFYPWSSRAIAPDDAPRAGETWIRLVCSHDTGQGEVEQFLDIARRHCS